MTVLFFYLSAVPLAVSLTTSVVLAFLMATVLPLALAFSPKVRVVTMLVIPSMCTG